LQYEGGDGQQQQQNGKFRSSSSVFWPASQPHTHSGQQQQHLGAHNATAVSRARDKIGAVKRRKAKLATEIAKKRVAKGLRGVLSEPDLQQGLESLASQMQPKLTKDDFQAAYAVHVRTPENLRLLAFADQTDAFQPFSHAVTPGGTLRPFQPHLAHLVNNAGSAASTAARSRRSTPFMTRHSTPFLSPLSETGSSTPFRTVSRSLSSPGLHIVRSPHHLQRLGLQAEQNFPFEQKQQKPPIDISHLTLNEQNHYGMVTESGRYVNDAHRLPHPEAGLNRTIEATLQASLFVPEHRKTAQQRAQEVRVRETELATPDNPAAAASHKALKNLNKHKVDTVTNAVVGVLPFAMKNSTFKKI